MIKPSVKNRDGESLLKSGESGAVLIFTEFQAHSIAAFLDENRLLRVYVKRPGLLAGFVCIGKISEIREEIGSVFVLLPGKEKGYLPFSELEGVENGRKIKCGDNLVVYIKKEAAKGKLVTLTTVLPEELQDLKNKAAHLTDFSVLKEGNDYIQEGFSFAIKHSEQFGRGFKTVTDDESVLQNLAVRYPDYPSNLYRDSQISLSAVYGLKGKIEEALSRKVWLKSGGCIVIDITEAMTVIDVNTSKSSRNTDAEEHFTEINKEACAEIVRQIALRNLSGIIILDLINMKNKANRTEVFEFLSSIAGQNDPWLHVVDMTKLGLVECTRKKTGKMLCEQLKV